MVHVLSWEAVRGAVAVAPGAVDGQPAAGDGLTVRERGHGADLDHGRVVPRQVVVAEQQRLQQPAAAAAARGVELVRRELRRLRLSGGQRRQARGDEADVAERGGAAVCLVEHRLRRLLAGEVVVERLLHPLHLVQERVVLVDHQRRVRARGRRRRRRHGRRQRERVARVVEERRREAAAGAGAA